jgi:DNA-binding winged helix-turn-helix (wHTH) protein
MNQGRNNAYRYLFDGFELRAATREVLDRRKGVPLCLQPKMFEVLLYLIEHRARVVMKDELVSQIWGGIAVSSGAVPQCVSMLRKVLGDTGRDQRILKTVYGYGYRFVCTAVLVALEDVTVSTGVYEPLTGQLEPS